MCLLRDNVNLENHRVSRKKNYYNIKKPVIEFS